MKRKILGISAVAVLSSSAMFAQLTGTLDTNFYPAARTNGTIIVQPTGKILLAGEGTGYGPKRLMSDGSLDSTFSSPVQHLQVLFDHPDGNIYGFGTGANRLSQTGAANLPFNEKITSFGYNGNTYSGRVNDGVLLADGSMIIVGKFDYVYQNSGAFVMNHILKVGVDMFTDHTFRYATGTGFNDEVTSIAVDTVNHKIYCGGKFSSYNGNAANGICRLNMDGTFDNTFNPGTGFNLNSLEYPRKLKFLSDGRLFVGGLFNTYNGIARYGALTLLPGGSLDTMFVSSNNTNGTYDVLELENGRLLVSGSFPRGVDMINATTGSWIYDATYYENFYDMGDISSGSIVYHIAKVETGKYIYGGNFYTTHGLAYDGLAEMYICDKFLDESLTYNNGVLSSNASGVTYEWIAVDDNENSIPLTNNTSQTFTPTVPGYYQVLITDAPCQQYSEWFDFYTVSVSEDEMTTVAVYPNPATTQVVIKGMVAGGELMITDQSGRTLQSVTHVQENHLLDVSGYAGGMYFIRMVSPLGSIHIEKLIIQ